jgi:hypothetical protein
MTELTFAPWFLDLVLAFTLAEWLVLVLRHRLTGRGLDPLNVSLGLAPGLMLMLALKLSSPAQLTWRPRGWRMPWTFAAAWPRPR